MRNFDPSSLVLLPFLSLASILPSRVKRHQNLPSPVPHYLPDTLFLGQRNAYIRLAEHFTGVHGVIYRLFVSLDTGQGKTQCTFRTYIYVYGDCSKPISRRGMISRREWNPSFAREKIGKLGRPTSTPKREQPVLCLSA